MWIQIGLSAAHAATIYVPADAPTIADAVAVASNGDVIRLSPGVYAESVTVIGASLTFEGGPGVVWVPDGDECLDCESNAVCTARDIRFDGLGQYRGIEVDSGSTLTVERCRFAHGYDDNGGGIQASNANSLIVRDSAFFDNEAATSGAHIRVTGTALTDIRSSTFISGHAGVDAGAIRVTASGDVYFERLWLIGNSADDDGGAIDVDATDTLELHRSFLCANSATDEGGGLVVRDAHSHLTGNIFLDNDSDNRGGGLLAAGGDISTINTDLVANRAPNGGAGVYATGVHSSLNDIYTDNTASAAYQSTSGTLSYGLFWNNSSGDANIALPTSVLLLDPELLARPPSGCDPSGLLPVQDSPILDAGDPERSDTDGSRSDIGAFGGSSPFDLSLVPIDADGDGVDSAVDCDDNEPAVYVGAFEIDCDGLDNDCNASTPDGFDADNDGSLSCDDCDDDDPTRSPNQSELIGDGIDSDCDLKELCYIDADLDGYGEQDIIVSTDSDCTDPGEAPRSNDLCPGFDDGLDADSDSVPDGCDETFGTGPDDTGDSSTDLPTQDTLRDSDGDGIPDSIDPSPNDAGGIDQAAPKVRAGCGCAHSSPALSPIALAGLLLVRRRR